MLGVILAAAFTFTATATGVEKGTPVEFLFAGRDSDRDYETLFLLDESIESLCRRIEAAGIPRGVAIDPGHCQLWPVGVPLSVKPALESLVSIELPDGVTLASPIYTGGSRDEKGSPVATTNMPAAFFSFFTLAQSPIVFNGIYEQGAVYNSFKAKETLEKGKRYSFTLDWDSSKKLKFIDVEFKPGNSVEILRNLKAQSKQEDVMLQAGFSDDLTLREAVSIANALSLVDSTHVKINGRHKGDFFYRAFLPLVKWRDRKERLSQPFEVSIGPSNRVVFIEEDWSVEGNDPKLIEKEISISEMKLHPQVNTVFFFAAKDTPLGVLKNVLRQVPESVFNHYIYSE